MTNNSKRIRKADVFAAYGVEYKDNKIVLPNGNMIPRLLINGNEKIGKGVYHWSMLPGTHDFDAVINGEYVNVKGTCACNCGGCYAMAGRYNMASVVNALASRTLIARENLEFMINAINGQIAADKIELVRVHVAGDFFSDDYISAWKIIAAMNPNTRFWTYTKVHTAENAFDDLNNFNVIKSVIPGVGFNFGHCGYILDVYNALKSEGKNVHICKCGFDKNQHCINCKGCSENEYVLFLEHGTDYKAEQDPLFPVLKAIALNQ